ncbi:MAG: DUF456 domain-containing protein [Rikenellaceae bacterium]
MDIALSVIALVMLVLAVIGCVIPAIPGPILAYGSLWIFYATDYSTLSMSYMLVLGVITLVVFFADYFLPPLIAQKFGGTKFSAWGSIIGMIIGMFVPPIGILVGMLLGAFIGELCFAKRSGSDSLIATIGTFLGFVVGTGLKLMLCFYLIYVVIAELYGVASEAISSSFAAL